MKISISGLLLFFVFFVAGCGGGGNGDSPGPLPDSDGDPGVLTSHLVSATAGMGGRVEPASQTVDDGAIALFTVTPEMGYVIDSVQGCGGFLDGTLYTTAPITEACTVTAAFAGDDNPILLSPPDLYGALLPGLRVVLQPHVAYAGDGALDFALLEAPDSMEIDPRSGLMYWTPTTADAGGYFAVHLSATDGASSNAVSFGIRVAAPTTVQTATEVLNDARIRVSVTENGLKLQGLEVILPASPTDTDDPQSLVLPPEISLVDPADVFDGGSLSSNAITRLTEFFRVDPMFVGAPYIEFITPSLELPEGRRPEELKYFVFSQPLNFPTPSWHAISLSSQLVDDTRMRVLLAATGHVGFIGLDAEGDQDESVPVGVSTMSTSVDAFAYSLQEPLNGVGALPIECAREGWWRDRHLCSARLPMGVLTPAQCPIKTLNECTVKVRIAGFKKNDWSSPPPDFRVEHVAGWAVDALLKISSAGLPFDDWSSGTLHDANIEVNINNDGGCSAAGWVSGAENYRVINLNGVSSIFKNFLCKGTLSVDFMKGTLAHEYLHHAQARAGNWQSEERELRRLWLIEGSAVWFEDEVFDPLNTYGDRSRPLNPGQNIAEVGISSVHDAGRAAYNAYARFPFFKMLQRTSSVTHNDHVGCNFGALNSQNRTLLAEMFQRYSSENDDAGRRLVNVLSDEAFECDFGNTFGGDGMANALEYFTWATQLENDMTLLDANEPRFEFNGPSKDVVLDASGYGGWDGVVRPLSSIPIGLRDTGPHGLVRTLTLTNRSEEARIGVSLRDSAGLRHAFDVAPNEMQFPTLHSDGVDGWFLTLVNANPDEIGAVSFSLTRMEWNTLAAFVRDPDGQEYWLEGKRWPRSDGTSWFELYGPDGISCTGEFDASGQGVLECNTGWKFSISIPQAVYEKGSGSHHTHSDAGFFVSVGWGGHADRDTLLERVVFVSQVDGAWDIFSVVLDGSDLVNLTETTANDRLPAASPCLSKIAFVSDRDGQNDIYVMNMDGSDVKRLTNHRLDDAFPVWSPDGSKIAFISQLGSGGATYDIYVMDSDGGNVVRLTDSRRNDTQPHWSPDGDSIVFVSERDGAADIFLMKADGSDQTNLTRTSATDTIPFFSPDGSRIAFVSDRDGDFDLWIMDVGGRNLVKLTSDGTDAVGWYSWSPDGKLIAFDSMENGVYDIYVVDPLTGIIRQVTDSTASDRFASWTWFGSKIAYLSDEDGTYTINVVDPDGQGLVRVFEGAVGEVFLPAASPVYEEGGGCFIATAAYGSYLEPRVAKLREFRDDYLLATSLGKVFVSHYYMWSPPIADVIRQHESLRVITRAILTPIVFGVQYPMQSSLILFVVGFVLVKRSRRESSRIGKQEHLKAR